MKPIENVTVIGAGIMGFGISKAIFKHNIDVTIFDLNAEQVTKTCEDLKKGARRGMDPKKVHKADSMEAAVTNADLVIEAVVEKLEVKNAVFEEIAKYAGRETIFSSNTSSLDISAMANASGRPERFLGLHFFNPAFLMRLVEITKTPMTSDETLQRVKTFLTAIKKDGIVCKESPGFVVNRILLPVLTEAFYILDKRSTPKNRIAIANDMDSAITRNQILLLGIFDLVDLTGMDTTWAVAERIYEGFGKIPRYLPSPLLKLYLEEGYKGRKTKQGIYYYANTRNDPDANPRLDANGAPIVPVAEPLFDPMELIAAIANESSRVLEEGIVESYKEIDFCLESAALWPKGPFALVKKFGVHEVRKKIMQLYEDSHRDPRYEPCPLLFNLPDELSDFLGS